MMTEASAPRRASPPSPDGGIIEGPAVNARIAGRVSALRAGLGLSLEALAARSGVSRSMISLVERGESSPTAVVLERLATGLGVPLASLFDAAIPADPLVRAAEQPVWRDPHSGYVRRNVSPSGALGSAASAVPYVRIVDVTFPPGGRVGYETAGREPAVYQQIWVLDGEIEVTVGVRAERLAAGDCLAFFLDEPVAFHNPTPAPARYAVVLCTTTGGLR
jgi:transcriptional regulator with XRE-family HTH domain